MVEIQDNPYQLSMGPKETSFDKMAKAHFGEQDRRLKEQKRLANIDIENIADYINNGMGISTLRGMGTQTPNTTNTLSGPDVIPTNARGLGTTALDAAIATEETPGLSSTARMRGASVNARGVRIPMLPGVVETITAVPGRGSTTVRGIVERHTGNLRFAYGSSPDSPNTQKKVMYNQMTKRQLENLLNIPKDTVTHHSLVNEAIRTHPSGLDYFPPASRDGRRKGTKNMRAVMDQLSQRSSPKQLTTPTQADTVALVGRALMERGVRNKT
jgi:hypothetical protein